MDEFDKIKELSDDIMGRKEPSFSEEKDGDDDNFHFTPVDMDRSDILEEKSARSYRLHLIALGAFASVFVIVLAVFLLWGEDKQPDKVITITATPNPVRIKPEQPGGADIPDQGKQIYNRVNARQAAPTKVERLFPEPEKPVLPEILIKQATPEQTFVAVEEIKAVNPLDEMPEPEVIVEEVPPAPKKEVMVLPTKKEEPVKVAQEKTTTVASKPKAEPAPAASKQSTQVWRIQLVSTSKKASAEAAWPTILKKNKALLSDMSYDVVSAEIAGKGTFYRLQAGRFNTREQAAALCTKLQANKQECVPVKGAEK